MGGSDIGAWYQTECVLPAGSPGPRMRHVEPCTPLARPPCPPLPHTSTQAAFVAGGLLAFPRTATVKHCGRSSRRRTPSRTPHGCCGSTRLGRRWKRRLPLPPIPTSSLRWLPTSRAYMKPGRRACTLLLSPSASAAGVDEDIGWLASRLWAACACGTQCRRTFCTSSL